MFATGAPSPERKQRMSANPEHARSGRGSVATLCTVGFIAALMQTIAFPLMPDFPALLNSTPENVSWMVTANLLGGALSAPVSGRAGDLYGHKRVLLVLLGLMALGSAIVSVSSSLAPALVGRALQGLLIGAVPLGTSIMRETVAPARLAGAITALSGTLGIGGAIGLPLSALISEHLGWRGVFVVAAALGAACALATWTLVPRMARPSAREPMDYVGTVGLVAALALVFLSLQRVVNGSWSVPVSLTAGGAGLAILAGWAVFEARTPHPVVDIRRDLTGPLAWINGVTVAAGVMVVSLYFVMPIVLRSPEASSFGFGLSITEAALCLTPAGVVMMLAAPMSARLLSRYGAPLTLSIGLTVLAIGNLVPAFFLNSLVAWVAAAAISGIGGSATYGAIPYLVLSFAARERTGSANSVNTLCRIFGSTSGSAIFGVMLASGATVTSGVTVPTPAAVRATLLVSCAFALAGAWIAWHRQRRHDPIDRLS
jgi:MFS family permease